jgi:hypothetical protein
MIPVQRQARTVAKESHFGQISRALIGPPHAAMHQHFLSLCPVLLLGIVQMPFEN